MNPTVLISSELNIFEVEDRRKISVIYHKLGGLHFRGERYFNFWGGIFTGMKMKVGVYLLLNLFPLLLYLFFLLLS